MRHSSRGLSPTRFAIVAIEVATLDAIRAELKHGASDGIQFVVHDPDDEANLCFAGAILKGERLLVNRTIFDADIVLPIGCARLPRHVDGGIFSSLFPRFSDAETIAKFRTPARRRDGEGASGGTAANRRGGLAAGCADGDRSGAGRRR